MPDVRIEFRSIFGSGTKDCAISETVSLLPEGWQAFAQAFVDDPDATQLTVTSANLGQTFTLTRLVMGAKVDSHA